MKNKVMTIISTIALTLFISVNSAHSQDKMGDMKMDNKGSMMDKMDMGKMHGMMKECMAMHKDGKMCDHQMMTDCEKKMNKIECEKMMKESKAAPAKK